LLLQQQQQVLLLQLLLRRRRWQRREPRAATINQLVQNKNKKATRRLRPKSAYARSTPRVPLAFRPIPEHKKRPTTTSSMSRRRYLGAGRIDVLLPRAMSATRSRKNNMARGGVIPQTLAGRGFTPELDWMLQPPFDRTQHTRRGGGGALLAAISQPKPGRFRPPSKMGRYRCIPSRDLLGQARAMRHREAEERRADENARRERRKRRQNRDHFVKVPGQSAAGSQLLRMSSLLSPLNSKSGC
jgi:hypothetical protein